MLSSTAKRERTILDAMDDPRVFGKWFKTPATWAAWRVFLRSMFALPMDDADLATYRQCTGRTLPHSAPFAEAWIVVGRRGGKSFIVALLAVFVACFRDWRPYLQPGETGIVMVLSVDRTQAKTIFKYCRALITLVPMLKRLLVRETADELELSNGVSIEIHTASYRAVRGRTVVCALLDESAFWRSEDTANPDFEIVNAITPGMATIPGAMMIGLSSPYAKRGVLYEAHRDHFGKDDSGVLVWQASTATMNPTIRQSFIDRAYAKDGTSAASEYGAQFRDDIATFIDGDLVDSLTRSEPREVPRLAGASYVAFVDPSGGRGDAMTIAIGHRDKERLIVDVARAVQPPFDPETVVQDFASLLQEYGVSSVTGDRYAGEWVSATFTRSGIRYEASESSKSEIYLETLPLFTRGIVELPPDAKLRGELVNLERRTSRVGRDIIDHAPRGHDDLANAVCGCLWRIGGRKERTMRAARPEDIFG